MDVYATEEEFTKQQNYLQLFLGKKFYETRLPLLVSLIMNKGNLWRTGKQAMTYK